MAKQRSRPQTIGSSLGTAALGILILIVGTILKSHFELSAAICNTYGGSTSQCVGDSTAFTVGQIMQPVGGIMIGVGLIVCVVLLISGGSSTKTARPPSVPTTPRAQPQANPSARIIDTGGLAGPSQPAAPKPPVSNENDW
jgi:hypothetical protein